MQSNDSDASSSEERPEPLLTAAGVSRTRSTPPGGPTSEGYQALSALSRVFPARLEAQLLVLRVAFSRDALAWIQVRAGGPAPAGDVACGELRTVCRFEARLPASSMWPRRLGRLDVVRAPHWPNAQHLPRPAMAESPLGRWVDPRGVAQGHFVFWHRTHVLSIAVHVDKSSCSVSRTMLKWMDSELEKQYGLNQWTRVPG